jgi:hypothetical protein
MRFAIDTPQMYALESATNVLGNVKGIDHLEDSPIGAALFGAAGACGLETGG